MWKAAVAVSCFFTVIFAAKQFAFLEPIPDKFENATGCYIKEQDIVIDFNESTSSKTQCKEYRCGNPEDKYYTIVTCGVVSASPSCTKVINACLPYPDCCPRFECPPVATTSEEHEITTETID